MANPSSARATTNSNERVTTVTLESYYMKRPRDEIKWTGLITANIEKGPNGAAIFEYTHVLLLRRENGRVYYLIDDEGSEYNGRVGSNVAVGFDRYFVQGIAPLIDDTTIQVRYLTPSWEHSNIRGDTNYQEWGEMNINGETVQITLNSAPHHYTPIAAGAHKLLRPDYSHQENAPTEFYRRIAPTSIYGNDAWFPIEIDGVKSSRYIHIGHLSHGCITVYDIYKWGKIYDYLISRRKDHIKSKYIGTIIVEPYTRNLPRI